MEGVCREVISDYTVAPMASGRYFPQPTADPSMCDCDRRLRGSTGWAVPEQLRVHLSSCQTSRILRTGLIRPSDGDERDLEELGLVALRRDRRPDQDLPRTPLEGDWPCVWLDATYLKVRHDGPIVSVAFIIAVGVSGAGRR